MILTLKSRFISFFLFLTFCIILNHHSQGQNRRIADSLIQVLDSKEITRLDKYEILRKISHEHPDFVIALSYARKSLDLAIDLGNLFLQARSFEEIGINERLLGNNAKSIEATLKALSIFDSLGENISMAASYVQLGSNAVSDENYNQAIEYFLNAEAIYQSTEEIINHAITVLNIGEAYRLAQQYDSAIYYFDLALELNETLNHHIVGSYSLGNLGMVYNAVGRLSESKEMLTTAIKMVRELGDPYSTSVYLAELANVNQKEGDLNTAEVNFKKALEIAQKDILKEQIRDISSMMVGFYKERQQYDLALTYQELFQVYQDSLVNKENIQKVEQIKAGYEIDKRESEIQLLGKINNQQKYISIGLGLGAFVFIVFTYLLYRGNQHKKRANVQLSKQRDEISKREEEKALLLKELNHRVKNNLQMISSLLNLQGNELIGHPAEESIKAGKFRVEALSLIHQKLYREDLYAQVSLPEYIEELVLNLCYSYDAAFEPKLNITPVSVDIDVAIPIALIINELVTNTLKYAFENVQNPEFLVSLEKSSDQLILQVYDNGVGFKQNPYVKSSSFGIKLVNSLVRQLEGVIEHKNENGTLWILKIKHKNEK